MLRLLHGTRFDRRCLHRNSHLHCLSRQVLTDVRDGTCCPGADHPGNPGQGAVDQISIAVMVVTLLVIFDGLKDHRQNKESQQ